MWVEGAALPTARTMVAGVSNGQRLFCFGGREGKFDEGAVLASALAHDPRTRAWEHLPDLPAACYGAAAVAIDSCIYLFGGKTETVPLATVSVYDEVKGGWRPSPPMTHERAFPCAVVRGSEGGTDYVLVCLRDYVRMLESDRVRESVCVKCVRGQGGGEGRQRQRQRQRDRENRAKTPNPMPKTKRPQPFSLKS